MEKQKLPSAWEFIKRGVAIYFAKENLIYLTKINIFGVLVSFLVFGPALVFSGMASALEEGNFGGITIWAIALFAVAALASIFWGVWLKVAIIKAIVAVVGNKTLGVKETFALSLKRIWPYALTSLLSGLAIGFGSILLIIPGIIFAVWFSFSTFIIVEKDVKATEALGESKTIVKGYFWPIIGRGFFFILFYILLEIAAAGLRIVGPLLIALISPFFLLLPYLLYRELLAINGKKDLTL